MLGLIMFIKFLIIIAGVWAAFALVYSTVRCLECVSDYYKKKTELLDNQQ